MAAYKVIQDIEAEDKLVGPLTFRQFLYACIGALCLYLSFLALTKHAAFLIAVFLPIAAVAAFFAFPWGRDQPTEIWALAKIQFMFKPRRRMWNQSGVRELVTITAPKKIERNYTNGLTQSEVRSRLQALADTIDSRGWAIKGSAVNINTFNTMPTVLTEPGSDRLINPASFPREVPAVDVQASDDVLDADNNPMARHLDQMINASTAAHRQQVIEAFRQVAPPTPPPATSRRQNMQAPVPPANNYWFAGQPQPAGPAIMQQPVYAQPAAPVLGGPQQPPIMPTAPPAYAVTPVPPPANDINQMDEEALMAQLRAQDSAEDAYNSHLHTIQPLDAAHRTHVHQPAQTPVKPSKPAAAAKPPAAPVTQTPDPGILALANNNDLSVATIARQANKELHDSDEVVIALH